MTHPSHDTRMSDLSPCDEVCKRCGATDESGDLAAPCTGIDELLPSNWRAQADDTDYAAVGRAFLDRFDHLVEHEPILAGYTPAADPLELLGDLVEMVHAARDASAPGARWRHLKRGTTYTELRRDVEVHAGRPISEGDRLVVYEGTDGKVWARPTAEFDDGRFELVGCSPTEDEPRNLRDELLAKLRTTAVWRFLTTIVLSLAELVEKSGARRPDAMTTTRLTLTSAPERPALDALIAEARAITTRRETISLDEEGARKALAMLAESRDSLSACIAEIERLNHPRRLAALGPPTPREASPLVGEVAAQNAVGGGATPGEGAEAGADEGWRWWSGTSEEWMSHGPFLTREEAIDAAREDGPDAFQDEAGVWKVGIYVCEATQPLLRLADWIVDPRYLLTDADDRLVDSDRVAGEFDDGPWFVATPDQERELAEAIKRACDEWQARHGLVFTCLTFAAQRNNDYVDVPLPAPGGRPDR